MRSPNAAPSRWEMSCTAAMMLLVISGPTGRKRSSSGIMLGAGLLVDCVPWYDWVMWPRLVSIDLGRCFLTRSSSRPGNDLRNPALMAGMIVLSDGLPSDA